MMNTSISFNELRKIYQDRFSLGFLGTDITNKFALISLICYLYKNLKSKNPDITYYSLIHKLGDEKGIPDNMCIALAIMCEDFSYGCKEFPTFDLKGKEIVAKIKELFHNALPF